MFDETIKPILNIVLFQCSVVALVKTKSIALWGWKNQKQKIDSLIAFNTDKNKLQYLAVLPSINYNFWTYF
jgi:hypothetical protein